MKKTSFSRKVIIAIGIILMIAGLSYCSYSIFFTSYYEVELSLEELDNITIAIVVTTAGIAMLSIVSPVKNNTTPNPDELPLDPPPSPDHYDFQ